MRTCPPVLLAATLLFGCAATPTGLPAPRTARYERSSPEAAEYLRYFHAGYASALRGHQSTRCPDGATLDGPVQIARSRSWTDGQGEGLIAWVEAADRAIVVRDRERLLVLLESLGDDATAAVDDRLSDQAGRRR